MTVSRLILAPGERERAEMPGAIEHRRHRAVDIAEDGAAEAVAYGEAGQLVERVPLVAVDILEKDERVPRGHGDPPRVRLVRA